MSTPATTQKIKAIRSSWTIWFFPVCAALICGWLFLEYFKQRGPEIQISFEDASGIQADKTRVRFRGVTIGKVTEITISEDNKNVIAHVALQAGAEHFAVAGAKYWLVLPKVSFEGVSGLETLFEGTYIAAQPGNEGADDQVEFKGQVGADTADGLQDTVAYLLETDNVGSVSEGDNVSFRGLNIGTVSKVMLSKTSQTVLVRVNIHSRYMKLVRTNTVFWRKMAIQAKLGLFNSELKVNSLDALMHGGVDLFTPDDAGPMAKPGTKFALLAAPPKGWEKWNPRLEFPSRAERETPSAKQASR